MSNRTHELAARIREAAKDISRNPVNKIYFIKKAKDFEISVTDDSGHRDILLGKAEGSHYGYAYLYAENEDEQGRYHAYREFPSTREIERRLDCVIKGDNLQDKGFSCTRYESYDGKTNALQKKLANRLSTYLKEQKACR